MVVHKRRVFLAVLAMISISSEALAVNKYVNIQSSKVTPTIPGEHIMTDVPFVVSTSLQPSNGTITGIQYSYGNYTNGYTTQTVQLCIAPLNTQSWTCQDISNNSATTSGYFKGYPCKQQVKMTYTLVGGSYTAPGAPGGFTNTLTYGCVYPG